MKTTVHPAPRIIAALLKAHGITNVVVSPGSRNVPLIIALTQEGGFKLLPVVDERTAGFIALGHAVRTGRTVALVCTSGTAVLNYAPAVAEAYYRNVPLLIISADRPTRRIDQDDSQTIRQSNALSEIVLESYDIPDCIAGENAGAYINRIVNEAVIATQGPVKGPVHINVHLDVPLNETEEYDKKDIRPIERIMCPSKLSRQQIDELSERLVNKKTALVIGHHVPDAHLNRAVQNISQNPNVAVFHEAQSNIKGLRCGVANIDSTLAHISANDKKPFVPEIVLTVGGPVLSQRLKDFLREHKNISHWYIGCRRNNILIDTYDSLSLTVDADPAGFLSAMAQRLKRKTRIDTGFNALWTGTSETAADLTSRFLSKTEWCDFAAVETLVSHLPAKVNLQVSNGMSIRYVQNTDYTRLHRIDSNRGCSGIEGSTSTAIGAALGCDIPTVLLTGDMSWTYDIGAMSLPFVPENLCIFILNNKGGDIFRNIGTTRNLRERESLISLPHEADIKRISESFGFEYHYADGFSELKSSVRKLYSRRTRPLLVEIDTTKCDNAKIYERYFEILKTNP